MKRLIAILLSGCLLSPSIASAAVAWNANSTAGTDSGNAAASPRTDTTMTVGAGANRALLCMVAFDKTFATPGTVTVNWDSTGTNQAMTFIGSKDNSTATCSVSFWGLIAPTSGNHTLRVAWTTGTAEEISWCSDFTGVNQTSVAAAFINLNTAAATNSAPAITITSAVGDLTVDAGNESATGPALTPTKTLIFSFSGIGNSNPNSSRAAGAASNVHSWTGQASVAWAEIGIDLAAAGAAATNVGPKSQKLDALGEL